MFWLEEEIILWSYQSEFHRKGLVWVRIDQLWLHRITIDFWNIFQWFSKMNDYFCMFVPKIHLMSIKTDALWFSIPDLFHKKSGARLQITGPFIKLRIVYIHMNRKILCVYIQAKKCVLTLMGAASEVHSPASFYRCRLCFRFLVVGCSWDIMHFIHML